MQLVRKLDRNARPAHDGLPARPRTILILCHAGPCHPTPAASFAWRRCPWTCFTATLCTNSSTVASPPPSSGRASASPPLRWSEGSRRPPGRHPHQLGAFLRAAPGKPLHGRQAARIVRRAANRATPLGGEATGVIRERQRRLGDVPGDLGGAPFARAGRRWNCSSVSVSTKAANSSLACSTAAISSALLVILTPPMTRPQCRLHSTW